MVIMSGPVDDAYVKSPAKVAQEVRGSVEPKVWVKVIVPSALVVISSPEASSRICSIFFNDL